MCILLLEFIIPVGIFEKYVPECDSCQTHITEINGRPAIPPQEGYTPTFFPVCKQKNICASILIISQHGVLDARLSTGVDAFSAE